MTRCWVFDIDGTLSNPEHRRHLVEKVPKDWDAFFAAVIDDKPIVPVIMMAGLLGNECPLVLVSGRSSVCREATVEWLRVHSIVYNALYMRKEGDRRADALIKQEILQQMRLDGWEPWMAFDDRDRVVKMWRENGVPCAQVAPGDF